MVKKIVVLTILGALLPRTALSQSAPFNPGFNETWNRNYFGFPAVVNWIPIFSVGDVINVSWSDDWVGSSNAINVWCGTPTILLVQIINNLDQNGNELLPVLDSWYDPCHLEYVVSDGQGNQIGNFNSGAFNIDNRTTERVATTWGAFAPSGAASSYTGGTLTVAPSTTAVTTATTKTTNSPRVTACAQPSASSNSNSSDSAHGFDSTSGSNDSLSFGAGVGVGIAIMAGVTLVAGLITWLIYRHRHSKPKPVMNANPDMSKYAGQLPAEMPGEARVEMPGVTYG